jgi:hypothetical protein
VHYKDGNKRNTDPNNLELWIKGHKHAMSVDDAIAWAKEILDRYG